MGATAVAVISLVVGVTGSVMSYQASNAAAKSQSQFSLLNAQAGAQAARLQGRQAMLGAEVQAAGARAQSASAANNAAALQEQTEAESRTTSENIRRSRDEFSRTLGAMRAGIGDSGVLETTGSPLDFLVKASEDEQLYESELRWQDENNRRAGYRKAAIEKSQSNQLGLNASLFQIQGAADQAAGRIAASRATMAGYEGIAVAQGMNAGATASLISNIGSNTQSAYNMYQNRTPRYR